MEQQTRISRRKKQRGVVVSNKMQKTIVVELERTMKHPKYGKVIKRSKNVYAHNEDKPLQIGDVVDIEETRPLSKLKRWRVV